MNVLNPVRAVEAHSSFRVAPTFAKLPKVSVVITNFNYGRFVGAAIESVAAQSYDELECLIVDDCSTDESDTVIADRLRSLNRARFRYIRLSENLGQLAAMKVGLAASSGLFVTFLDSDDLLLPDFIEQHVSAHLNSSFSASISASDTFQISEDGRLLEGTYIR